MDRPWRNAPPDRVQAMGSRDQRDRAAKQDANHRCMWTQRCRKINLCTLSRQCHLAAYLGRRVFGYGCRTARIYPIWDGFVAFIDSANPWTCTHSYEDHVITVSYAKVSLGFANLILIRAFHFGFASPASDPQKYVAMIQSLADTYNNLLSNQNVPLVINTDGWIKGMGNDLLGTVIEIFQPSDVVQFQGTTSSTMFTLPTKYKDFAHHRIQSWIETVPASCNEPKLLRQYRLRSYFLHQNPMCPGATTKQLVRIATNSKRWVRHHTCDYYKIDR